MLLVGSRALLAHGLKIGRRPSDWDVIGTAKDFDNLLLSESMSKNLKHAPRVISPNKKMALFLKDGTIIDFEVADSSPSSVWLLDNYEGLNYYMTRTKYGTAVHPDVVLALKLSHRYLKNSPFFRKTMDDILALRGLKYRVPPQLAQFVKDRQKETLNYGHPSLKRDKAKFFSGDGVKYKYEHDDIHEAIAMMSLPAYKWFQKDASVDVSVSKEKWDDCDTLIKLNSVLEESYVLALERSQIPTDFSIAPRTSFLIALEKVCTSITSGWWREYAWENYYRVLGMYSDDYVDRFQKALSEGRIREYQGTGA